MVERTEANRGRVPHVLAKGKAQVKDNIAVLGPSATKPYG